MHEKNTLYLYHYALSALALIALGRGVIRASRARQRHGDDARYRELEHRVVWRYLQRPDQRGAATPERARRDRRRGHGHLGRGRDCQPSAVEQPQGATAGLRRLYR